MTTIWDALTTMALLLGAMCTVVIGAEAVRGTDGRRLRSALPRPCLAPLVGAALALVGATAGARERRVASPGHELRGALEPPWSEVDGPRPPRPFARTGGGPPWAPHVGGPHLLRPSTPPVRVVRGAPRPAGLGAHGAPRPRREDGARIARDLETPAPRPCTSHHTVLPGDTLWSIAAVALDTNDPARVARYWPKIHRKNRAAIGPDPNLIRPGQVLELPREC